MQNMSFDPYFMVHWTSLWIPSHIFLISFIMWHFFFFFQIKSVDLKTSICKTVIGPETDSDGVIKFQLNEPGGLCVSQDKVYIADTNNHHIRVLDLKTQSISSVSKLFRNIVSHFMRCFYKAFWWWIDYQKWSSQIFNVYSCFLGKFWKFVYFQLIFDKDQIIEISRKADIQAMTESNTL